MPVDRVSPQDAAKLLEQGWKYVDVRSVPEFEGGHPPGAFNVPLMHAGPSGMEPNADFMPVIERSFSRDDQMVIGCRSGKRSLTAAEMMIDRGFTKVVDMRGGFGGEKDPAGDVTYSGWQGRDLPISTAAQPGRTYSELQRSSK